MKKLILILLVSLVMINFVSAKLSQEQLDEAVSKVLQKVPYCEDYQGVRNFILSQDCAPQVIQGSQSFSCGDNINHTYECRFGIHYLDGEVISILSSKTEINYVKTEGDNSPVTTGNDSPINQTNLFFQLFWSKGTIGGIIFAGIIWLITRMIYYKIKNKKIQKLK